MTTINTVRYKLYSYLIAIYRGKLIDWKLTNFTNMHRRPTIMPKKQTLACGDERRFEVDSIATTKSSNKDNNNKE